MKIELTDEEATTILVAVDFWGAELEAQLKSSLYEEAEEEDRINMQNDINETEQIWQKLFTAQQRFRNSIADAVGEGEQPNNTTNASVDPFTLPTRSNYENME